VYRERLFPWLIDRLAGDEKLQAIRDRVVEKAAGHVIEIGSGTGANFLSYTDAITSLTTIDPNPGMNRRARRRIKYLEFPVDAREVRCEALPMKDASFDSAVMTFTLCSLPDAAAGLSEVRRVLKPGGRLLFLEHGLSDRPNLVRWQHRLTPLQNRLCDGCSLDKPIAGMITEAGFTIGELSNYYLDGVPKVLGYMYEGCATK
jgi:ubiquinone/menaquinone biosynthesis C-methylase UbiE